MSHDYGGLARGFARSRAKPDRTKVVYFLEKGRKENGGGFLAELKVRCSGVGRSSGVVVVVVVLPLGKNDPSKI